MGHTKLSVWVWPDFALQAFATIPVGYFWWVWPGGPPAETIEETRVAHGRNRLVRNPTP